MALALNTTLIISCEESEEGSGPTIVHSTGVANYRVQPEVIRILQESCSNDNLCDNEKGVQCVHPAAHILETFQNAGFTVTSTSTSGSRKMWVLTKTSGGGATHPTEPPKTDEEEKEEEPNNEDNNAEEEN